MIFLLTLLLLGSWSPIFFVKYTRTISMKCFQFKLHSQYNERSKIFKVQNVRSLWQISSFKTRLNKTCVRLSRASRIDSLNFGFFFFRPEISAFYILVVLIYCKFVFFFFLSFLLGSFPD